MAFFVSFCATLKTFAQFTVVEKVVNNETVKDVNPSKYLTPVFSQVTDIVQISLILFIPFTVCVLFAVLTVVTIKTSNLAMLNGSSVDKQRHQKESVVTRMLLTVVLFYLLSCFFIGLRYILRAKLGRARYYSHGLGMTIFDCLATNILLLNSSINLILYSASSATFLQTFMEIFFRKARQKERASLHSVSNETMKTLSVPELSELN